jgi:hypothetical protein
MRAASPSVFSATVLPPVFGPLITSARRRPRSRSIGTAVAGSSKGWRAPTSRTSSFTATSAPRHARETEPLATVRSIAAVASTSVSSTSARSPTARDSSRRMRSASSRSSPATSECLLFSSTTSKGSTNSVWPESDESCTMPGTLRRALALTASTGRPPRSVTKSSWRCSRRPLDRTSCCIFSVTRCLPLRSSARSFRRRGEAVSRRSDPSSSTARSIVSASGRSDGSIRPAISCSSGASCCSSEARARSAPAIVSATCRRAPAPSAPPRAARAAGLRTSRMPSSGGSSAASRSAIASLVSACRPATSSASGDGSRECAAASPCSVAVARATRCRIAPNSSASSVLASTRRV